jgi:hypothetical protein
VKVLCGEGVANHTDPESCAASCEGRSEALTGDGIVRLNSRRPVRALRQAGPPLFLLTNRQRARPDSMTKIAYTYLP